MKLLSPVCLSLLALVPASALRAQPAPAPAPAVENAAAPVPAFSEAQLLETFGWYMGRRLGISELGFTPEEVTAILKGIAHASSGAEAPYDLEAIGPQLDAFMQRKQDEYLAKVRAQSETESATLLAEAAKRPGAQVLPSGVVFEIVQTGTGPFPTPADTVTVHYTGRLADGTVFDSSVERGQPASFRLDEVLDGWQEGLQKINKGGKLRLTVPASQGYGDNPPPGSPIPPAAALSFEIDLLDIAAAPAAPAPAPAPATK
jgi:FKBP-type peptidyl-prolyl cis-trans isomerase